MVKKAKQIILIIFLIINFICAGIFFYFANEKLFYDYTNWKEVEIPTNTPVKAKIKIPNEWEIQINNNWISIIDRTSKNIIAEQVFQGNLIYFYDDEKTNWNELIFNDAIPYDIKNKKNFSYEKGYSNSICEYKFHVENIDLQCLFLVIYDSNIEEENEVLFLIFYDNINENDFNKLIVSYTWGGSLK